MRGPSLPLDWQQRQQELLEEIVVTDDNHQEHLQHPNRWDVYKDIPFVSTSTAFYGMQGMCDPNPLIDPQSPIYYPNCTQANNDISTGGVVAPTPVNSIIHQKASDLAPILKA